MSDGNAELDLTPEEMGLPDAGSASVPEPSEVVEAPAEQSAFSRYIDAVTRDDKDAADAAAGELDAGVDVCWAKINELRGNGKLPSSGDKVNRYKFTSKTSDGEDVVLRVTDVPTDRPTAKGTTVISIDRVNPGVDNKGRRVGRNVGVIEVEESPGFKRGVSFMDYGGTSSRYDIFHLPEPRRDWSEHRFGQENPIADPVAKAQEFLGMLERGTLTQTRGSGNWVDVPPKGPATEGSEQV